jgi:hypothetical protein
MIIWVGITVGLLKRRSSVLCPDGGVVKPAMKVSQTAAKPPPRHKKIFAGNEEFKARVVHPHENREVG